VRAAGRRAGRDRRRRVVPAPRHLPPHVPLAAHARCGRPARAAPAGGRRPRARAARAGRGVLRVRRHVLAEERGHLRRDAAGQGGSRGRHRRGGAHGGRLVLPHAHRRRAVAHGSGGATHAPRGDPRLDPRGPRRARRRRRPADRPAGGSPMSTFLGMPDAGAPATLSGVGRPDDPLHWGTSFPDAARTALADGQLRRNLGNATSTIRAKRARVVGEVPDWEALRDAGSALKTDVMARLPELLEELERNVTARGGVVHWARDAAEANRIVADIVRAKETDEVVKVKSMATQEIGLNEALAEEGIA